MGWASLIRWIFERVVGAVERQGLSRRQAAAHFGVSYSAVINWVKPYR